MILKGGNVALGPWVKNIDSYTKMTEGTETVLGDLFSMKGYKCFHKRYKCKEITECCLSREENQIYWPSKMSLSFHLRNVGLEAEVLVGACVLRCWA